MKIAIYTDPLMGRGGGSRLIIQLANALKADIITSGFEKKLRPQLNQHIKVIDIGNFSISKNYSLGYLLEAPLRFIFCKNYKYDVKIFIGSFSIFASRKNENNILYCLTPNRIMYDLKKWKFKNSNFLQKIVYAAHIAFFNKIDQMKVKNNYPKIITMTKEVQKRIKKYYDKDSSIIYPPLSSLEYKFREFGDYFLAVSRLAPEKRIDMIATAFTKMKDKKLIIVGDGSEKEKIERIIGKHSNIKMLNNVDDRKLNSLYSNCLATIYMPVSEDFGLVPLEGMAFGKACIAVDEGGCLETVIEKKTGYLIKPNIESIIKAVKQHNIEKAKKMKIECTKWSKNFNLQDYTDKWGTLLNSYN